MSTTLAALPDTLLREAAQWRLIGLLFECPTPEWRERVSALAAEISDSDLKAAADAAQTEAYEGLYHSIFGPGGPAPPREVSRRAWVQPGALLSELQAYYDAFAYRPTLSEPFDHVAVEAGFFGWLRFKEAYAVMSGDAEHAEVTSDAAQMFLKEHLSHVAEPLALELAASGVSYLALAGAAMLKQVGPRREMPVVAGDEFAACTEGCSFETMNDE